MLYQGEKMTQNSVSHIITNYGIRLSQEEVEVGGGGGDVHWE